MNKKPIFSIEELNQYDKYDQAHKLQITSKLASSRFNIDEQANHALAFQTKSLEQSSSGIFGEPARSSLVSSIETNFSPQNFIANSHTQHKILDEGKKVSGVSVTIQGRRGQAAASVGGVTKAGATGIRQKKLAELPPSYAERMARAAVLQARRDKEEAKRMKVIRKQERQFHKMMQKLKNKQKMQGESLTNQSEDEEDYLTEEYEGESSSSQSQQEQEDASDKHEQPLNNNTSIQKKIEMAKQTEKDEKIRSLNHTEVTQSLALNPFKKTPHGDMVAGYLEESRRLQTLHLSSDQKDRVKKFQEAQSVDIGDSVNENQNKVSSTGRTHDFTKQSQLFRHKKHPINVNIALFDKQNYIDGLKISKPSNEIIKKSQISSSVLDVKIIKSNQIDSERQDNASSQLINQDNQINITRVKNKKEISKEDFSSAQQSDNQYQDINFQKQVSQQQMGVVNRFTSNSNLQQQQKNYNSQAPKSYHTNQFILNKPTHSNRQQSNQHPIDMRASIGISLLENPKPLNIHVKGFPCSSSPFTPVQAIPSAQAFVRSPKFLSDIEQFRLSKNMPKLFRGQRDINAEYFRNCFDQTALNYSFLLQDQKQLTESNQRKRVALSLNFEEGMRYGESNLYRESRTNLPSIHRSQVFDQSPGSQTAESVLKIDGSKFLNKNTQLAMQKQRISLNILQQETGAIKAVQVQNELIKINNQLNYFSTAFMKSPKLKSEIVKCQQILSNKAKLQGNQMNINSSHNIPSSILNTRDKLKQIYKYQSQFLQSQINSAQRQDLETLFPDKYKNQTLKLGKNSHKMINLDVKQQNGSDNDDFRLSPLQVNSRVDSHEHKRIEISSSPLIKLLETTDKKLSPPSHNQEPQSIKQFNNAKFVKIDSSQIPYTGDMSFERSTDSLGRGSRTSKQLVSPNQSPSRSSVPNTAYKHRKSSFKTMQQLEIERQQREIEDFQEFIKEQETPREPVDDPASNIQIYKMKGKEEIIHLTDQLVKYRQLKQEQERIRMAQAEALESKGNTLGMAISEKQMQKPIFVKRVTNNSPQKRQNQQIDSILKNIRTNAQQEIKNQNTIQSINKIKSKRQSFNLNSAFAKKLSNIDSEAEGNDSNDIAQEQKVNIQNQLGKKSDRIKNPDMCFIQKKAFNFMHQIYVDDERYIVDPNESKRATFIEQATINEMHDNYPQSHQKEILKKMSQIECKEHNNQLTGEFEFEQLLFKKLSQFYGDLLDDKHNKVALEQLCQIFIEQIKENDQLLDFKSLRERLLALDVRGKSFYEQLRAVNPHVFIKTDDNLKEDTEFKFIGSRQMEKIEVMNSREHHIHCLNPMKKVFVNKLIFDTLIKGIIGKEFADENNHIQNKRTSIIPNKFLLQNQRKRDLDKDKQQQQRQIRKKSRSKTIESAGSADSLKISEKILNMKNGIMGAFQQQFSDHEHFEQQTKQQMQVRNPSITGSAINKSDIIDMIITDYSKKDFNDSSIYGGSEGDVVKTFAKKNIRNTSELFLKEYDKQKFFEEQKYFQKNPSLNPGSQTDFSLKLTKDYKQCLLQPHFTLIQNNQLYLKDNYMNPIVVEALCQFIKSQTVLGLKKLAMQTSSAQRIGTAFSQNKELMQLQDLNLNQVFIETLMIDDCQLTDKDIAILMETIAIQGRLRSITIVKNQFGKQSIQVLQNILSHSYKGFSKADTTKNFNNEHKNFNANPFFPLESINLTDIKCQRSECLKIVTALADNSMSKPLKQIKLSGLDMNDQEIGNQIGIILEVNQQLLKLDLSFSKMFPQQLANITKYLADEATNSGNLKLQYLNLSYINIEQDGNQNKVANQQTADKIIEDLSILIKNAHQLIHLDISGMCLKERVFKLLNCILTSESQTIVSIHLHDNQFSLEQKERILNIMGIQTNRYFAFKDTLNLHEQDMIGHTIINKHFSKQQKIQNMAHQFFNTHQNKTIQKKQESILSREKQYQFQIINNELTQELKESQKQIKTDVSGGLCRDRTIKDPMILTRKIGHQELIFNSVQYSIAELNADNSEERWTFNNSPNGEDCYVCQMHNYVQIFYNREKAHLDFKTINDMKIKQKLVEFYGLNKNQSYMRGSPILLSSINNWILTRLIDVQIFSSLLKAEDENFTKISAEQQKKTLKVILNQERERLQQKTKGKMQLKGNNSRKNDPDEEALTVLENESRYLDTKYIEDEVMRAKQRANNIRQSIALQDSATYHALVGINQLQKTKPYDPQDTGRKPLEQYQVENNTNIIELTRQLDIVDQCAPKEWLQIINKCQKYCDDIVSINQPKQDSSQNIGITYLQSPRPSMLSQIVQPLQQNEATNKSHNQTQTNFQNLHQSEQQSKLEPNPNELSADSQTFYIFAGFVRPGRHVIIVYDPPGPQAPQGSIGNFYRKDILIEVRHGEILVQSAKIAEKIGREAPERDINLLGQLSYIGTTLEFSRDNGIDNTKAIEQQILHNQHVLNSDLSHSDFNSAVMLMEQTLFFEMKELISASYIVVLEAYQIYLTEWNFPQSSLQKFIVFLTEIGQIKPKSKTIQPSQTIITEDEVLKLFFQQPNSKQDIQSQSSTIYRHQFIRLIFSIAYQNFIKCYSEDSQRMIPFCHQNLILPLKKYIKRHGGSQFRFRTKYLWSKKVQGVILANKQIFRELYLKFLINGKFTIQSFLKMLTQMNLILNRCENFKPPVTHIEMAKRLFGQSKKTQIREDNYYFYSFLTESEFYELVVRLVQEVYHKSFAVDDNENDAEEDQAEERQPKGKLASVQGDLKAILRLKILATESLDFKIFEFLSTDVSECLGQILIVKDIDEISAEESLVKKKKIFQNAGLDQLKKLKQSAESIINQIAKRNNEECSSDEFQ